MNIRSLPLIALALALGIGLVLANGSSEARRYGKSHKSKAGVFDYYALVLSWSPTFCDSNAGRHAREQCGRNRHYAFVLHGLWPQYEKGWPQNCRVGKGQFYIPRKTIDSMLDIMPSKRLVIHEWKKHGTCSGLGNKDYFALARQLYNSIKVPQRFQNPNSFITTTPQQVEAAFIKANNGMDASMISVQCGRRKRLKEIRFCFNKNGKLRSCGTNERRKCHARQLVLPPVR